MNNKQYHYIPYFALILLWLSCQKPQDFPLKTGNNVLAFTLSYANDATKNYFPVSVVEDSLQGEIQFKIPVVANNSLTQMRPTITVSTGAKVTPAFIGNMDFSKPYRFTVTSEDGQAKKYLLVVYN
jgi:hypothetical protein